MTRDVKQLVKRARRMGLAFVLGGRHGRIYHPANPGHFVTISTTPSTSNAVHHMRADIRRCFGIRV
jgi:hypothetical protein